MKTLSPQEFFAFLNGIFQQKYQDNSEITISYLKEQLFDENDNENEIADFFSYCENLIKQTAIEDWDISHLQNQLKKTKLSPEQQDSFLKFWRAQKSKIHQKLVQNSTWNNSLNKFSWRIDSKTKSKEKEEINELTAIVEMVVGKRNQETKSEVIRFELNRDELSKVKKEMNNIKSTFTKYG